MWKIKSFQSKMEEKEGRGASKLLLGPRYIFIGPGARIGCQKTGEMNLHPHDSFSKGGNEFMSISSLRGQYKYIYWLLSKL